MLNNLKTRVDVLIQIGYDLSDNPNNYNKTQLDNLEKLLPVLSDSSVTGSLAVKYYELAITPVTDSLLSYWSGNYISKPIYKSLIKFYHDDIDNIDILIMINSVINRSLLAIKEDNDLYYKLQISKLVMYLNKLLAYKLDEVYPTELIAEIKVLFTQLGLFSRIAEEDGGDSSNE